MCFADTQLARQLHQECTQVVCGNMEAQKRLADSNSTPEIDLGLETDWIFFFGGFHHDRDSRVFIEN